MSVQPFVEAQAIRSALSWTMSSGLGVEQLSGADPWSNEVRRKSRLRSPGLASANFWKSWTERRNSWPTRTSSVPSHALVRLQLCVRSATTLARCSRDSIHLFATGMQASLVRPCEASSKFPSAPKSPSKQEGGHHSALHSSSWNSHSPPGPVSMHHQRRAMQAVKRV